MTEDTVLNILIPLVLANVIFQLLLVKRLNRWQMDRARKRIAAQWNSTTGVVTKAEEQVRGGSFYEDIRSIPDAPPSWKQNTEHIWLISYSFNVAGKKYENDDAVHSPQPPKTALADPSAQNDGQSMLQSAMNDFSNTLRNGFYRPAPNDPIIVYYQRNNPGKSQCRDPLDTNQTHSTCLCTVGFLLGTFVLPAVLLVLLQRFL